MTPTTNTVTMIISEHKQYGQSMRQWTNQAPTIPRHSATKKLLAVPALLATLEENIQIPDRNGEMQHVWALIDCGASNICMTQRLLKRLGISGGTHHNPRHDRRCDATCKGKPEDADHSAVLGLSRTGRQIRRASRTNAGRRSSTWLTMGSQTTS